MKKINEFLSTPSARRATYSAVVDRLKRIISIHALREEGDVVPGRLAARRRLFLSTPSARRATILYSHRERKSPISIHALREEGDLQSV